MGVGLGMEGGGPVVATINKSSKSHERISFVEKTGQSLR